MHHHPMRHLYLALIGFALMLGVQAAESPLDFTMANIEGEEIDLSQYKGKVVLIVNVASKCGLTKQYTALQELYDTYGDQGLVILGFPANNFGGQEPGTDAEIKLFCQQKYDVSFDMFSKISVKGDDQHPLFAYLTSEETNPRFAGPIKWNFNKFLIDRQGNVVNRFEPATKPDAPKVLAAIQAELAKAAN